MWSEWCVAHPSSWWQNKVCPLHMHENIGITLRDWVVGSCMYRDR